MKQREISEKEGFVMKSYGLDPSVMDGCKGCLFESGEMIFTQGMQEPFLYIMLKGKVRVSILASNGKQLNLCYYISQGILGEVEFMQGNISASATSMAVEPTLCIVIPLKQYETSLRENVIFMNEVAKGLSMKLLNSSQAYISSALYTSVERLCTYILVAERNGVFSDMLKEVTQFTGISYRNLFRVLKQLCEDGALERIDRGYKILDYGYLQKNGIDEVGLERS